MGIEEQWNAVNISDNNDPLIKATIHLIGEQGNTITLTVRTPDGNPLANGYRVLWYEAGGTSPIALGNALNGANPDSVYEYEVILDSELLSQYRQPGRVVIEDSSIL